MLMARVWTAANYVTAALFVFSLVIQFNDPDPLRWMVVYGSAALICVLEARRRVTWPVAAGMAVIALGAAAWIARDLNPAPVGSLFEHWEMKNTVIEETREVGGLLIVTAWMLVITVATIGRARLRRKAASATPASESVRLVVAFVVCSSLMSAAVPEAFAQARTVPDSLSLEEVRAIVQAAGAAAVFERVSQPSKYLTDFIGVQAMKPVAASTIVADLVPRYARLESQNEHSLTLDFNDGPRVTFKYGTTLYINGNPVDGAYARVAVRAPASYPAEPVAFRRMLEQAGLADKYLIPNPYYEAEQIAAARMQNAAAVQTVTVKRDTAGLGAQKYAIVVVGETHGSTAPYEKARALLQSPDIDWIGLEMLSENMQPALDAFLREEPGSAEFERSRAALVDYYRANWNTRGHEVTADPAQNPYFRLIELARVAGKPAYALDTYPKYIVFRFGEFPLGATTRDYVWASNLPARGRGIVYGGSSHFMPSRKPNVLTFLRERHGDIRIFAVRSDN